MGEKKIKHYSPEFKLKVVLEALKEDKTINELASKYQLFPKTISSWKKQFIDNAELAFTKEKYVKGYKDEIKGLNSEKDHLYKEIGKLTAQLSWAKKKIEYLGLDD